jgi:hypothetical protein
MNRFFKVNEAGFSVTEATFFNPVTGESFSKIVWDADNPQVERENAELYKIPLNDEVRHLWLNHNGIICKGDTVEVFKGRKVPVGTVAVVTDIRPFCDRYGRVQCRYAYFSNGMRTNIDNCRLVAVEQVG